MECRWLILLALAGPASAAPQWEQLTDEDGIVVWQREVVGTSLVEFRGRGVVKAPLKKILAVLRDQKRKTEWMASCAENRAIERLPGNRMIIYNRTDSPNFIVSDRDVVLDAAATHDLAKRTVTLNFKETSDPRQPPVDGVVRMPKVRGSWHMQYLGPVLVEVTYQVQADPGGSLPNWLVNWASADIPRHSLLGLRDQVTKNGYDEELAAIEAAFDWSSLEQMKTASATVAR